MPQWLADLFQTPQASSALAGALGGVVRWVTLKEKLRDGIASVVVGGICAVFLGPAIQPAVASLIGSFVLEEASRQAFSGFLIGLGGIAIAGFLIDFLKRWAKRDVPIPGGEAHPPTPPPKGDDKK